MIFSLPHLRLGISSTISRDVEKNPIPAFEMKEPGQFPTISLI